MANRLPPAFSKHLRPVVKPSTAPAPRERQNEEALRHAMTLHMQGRLREAERICLTLLSQNPRNAKARYIAGKIALDAGDDSLAAEHFEIAVNESPREPLFLVAYGDVCRFDYELAIKQYRKALSIRPNMVDAMSGLARAYVIAGRGEKALEAWETVLRLQPEHETARLGLANALTTLGRADEASAQIRESIARGKAIGIAYDAFANTRKFTSEPPELKAILGALEGDRLDPRKATSLHHAAGKILNDLKRYDEAMDQFVKFNRTSGQDYDIGAYRQIVDHTIEAFSADVMASKAGDGDPTTVPVFIVGMPRSGTTLTEQICSSHPDVFGAGELPTLRLAASQIGLAKNAPGEFHSALSGLTSQRLRASAAEYLGYVRRLAPDALRIVDKRPHNFELVGLIALLFPNARIIHCRRDAIDNCVSCFVTKFADKHGYNADLTTLGLYYREYDRLMRHWDVVLPGRIHQVSYEAMIADQEAESRRLIEFLGVPWDDACLRFHENDRAVVTASHWQVRQPLYQTSVKRWKNYVTKIQPLIDALGDLAKV